MEAAHAYQPYVLMDFESVPPEALELLAHDHFRLRVFVGASQSKIPFAFAFAAVGKRWSANASQGGRALAK